MEKAMFYKKKNGQQVQCQLCPHNCVIKEGSVGICRARKNEQGDLYSLNYGEISSSGVDPVEKKPLYHFYPGSSIMSVGTWGCNFACPFCQNWRISQENPPVREMSPSQVVDVALKKNCRGIAYTYSEPLIWYEFVKDTAELAGEQGLKNILVTNGYINQEPLKELLPLIDAANVDLKSAGDRFYQDYCQGQRKPVLESIKLMYNRIHLEITTLVITDLNDNSREMEELFAWIADELGPEVPLHLSRYYPAYKLDKQQTSLSMMKYLYSRAAEYLQYVYLGNTGLREFNVTSCPNCGAEVIDRSGYRVIKSIEKNFCTECGQEIAGEF